jgi:hypothetical protein
MEEPEKCWNSLEESGKLDLNGGTRKMLEFFGGIRKIEILGGTQKI